MATRSRAAPSARLLGACLLTAVAWWTAFYAFSVAQWWIPAAPALGIAMVVGFGLVGLLALREAPLGRLGLAKPRTRDLLCVGLLLPTYPLGVALEGWMRARLLAPPSSGFESSNDILVAGLSSAPITTLLAFLVLLPAMQEWFFRGVLLHGLVGRMGALKGLLVTSALSAVAFAGGLPTREGIAVASAAFCWSLLLGVVVLATRSLAAAVLLRAGLIAQWIASTASAGDPAGVAQGRPLTLLLCGASVAAGLFLLRRWALRSAAGAGAQAHPEQPQSAGDPGGARQRRIRFPGVGVGVATGLLVAECEVIVHTMLDSFGGAGIWRELATSFGIYLPVGVALDILVQLLPPHRITKRPLVRAVPLVALALLVELRLGMVSATAFTVVPLAVIWAWACHVPWARPLAGAAALYAFAVALPPRAVSSSPPAASAARAGAPSFVVVVLDTVRRDHCSVYGYPRPTTPALDALARRGVRFDRAYSTSCWSVESHGSLFSGLLPHSHGATFEHMRLDDAVPTLASVLAAHGYQTAGFSANPYVTTTTGMARGFASFVDLWRPFVTSRAMVGTLLRARLGSTPNDKGGAAAVTEVRQWLGRRDTTRPYFLFVNLMEAHSPYQDSPHYRKFTDAKLSAGELEAIGREAHDAQWRGTPVAQSNLAATVDLLDGAITSADAYLGAILDAVGDAPYVVVLSDHGELAGEHGLYGHMTGLYEPLIRVPMLAAGPGLRHGMVIDEPVSTLDILPTLLSLAAVPAPKNEGLDLAPALLGSGPRPPADRPMVAEHYRSQAASRWRRSPEEMAPLVARKMAVVSQGRKRVVAEDGSDLGYDLVADPDENRPGPGTATGLAAIAPPNPAIAGKVELDPAQIEALKSLGYVR